MFSMRSQLTLIICLVTVLACGIQSAAQDKPSMKPTTKPTPRTVRTRGIKIAVIVVDAKYTGKVVKGAPYSATAITESTQTLADANQIVQKREVAYYRDSEGRMRIERRLDTIDKRTEKDSIDKWAVAGRIVIISDPVAGKSYNLDPRNKVAVKSSPYHDDKLQDDLADFPADATETKKLEAFSLAARKIEESSGRIKHESLAKKTFELVEAEGTRTTVTIPAGEIGNKLPIEIVDETWYAPDLRAIVMTRHSDPRRGEVIWRLTNINRGEPDPSLFRVPADYKIQELYRIKYSPTPSQKPRRKQAEPARRSKDVP